MPIAIVLFIEATVEPGLVLPKAQPVPLPGGFSGYAVGLATRCMSEMPLEPAVKAMTAV